MIPDGKAPGECIIRAAAIRGDEYDKSAWLAEVDEHFRTPTDASPMPFRVPSFSSLAQGPAAERGPG